jgi:hypothetical protein
MFSKTCVILMLSEFSPILTDIGGLQDGHARALLAFLVPSITDPAQ